MNRRRLNDAAIEMLRVLVIAGVLLGSVPATAQPHEWAHPELQWNTIETENFYVHFHDGAELTGKLTAKIAEDVFGPITALYGYKPDGKIHFVIKDYDDIANGAAYYLDNKVEIWASSMDFELRGTHNWLRNVITHEFTHMIQLGSARKLTRYVPAIYLQGFGYEDEKRVDVLLGYPDRIVSYPILLTTVPPWFAEGVAQFQLPGLGYDHWDSHRDMLLRTAVVEDEMLSYNEMGVFAKNSVGSERVYNQGYSLAGYIAEQYGVESLGEISRNMQSLLRFSFDSAIKKSVGKSGDDIYDEWKAHLQEKYDYQLKDIRKKVVNGELVQEEGTGNFYPRWSPDGRSIAFLTNQGADYLSMTSLIVHDPETEESKLIKGGVRHAFDWSADGNRLVYSRKTEDNPHHSAVFDLYLYDRISEEEERLTHGARAHSPNWAPDGERIACVVNLDGTQNLAVFNLEQKTLNYLTDFEEQEQAYTPVWSPDGRSIVFAFSNDKPGRDLYRYDFTDQSLTKLLDDGADSRDPFFSKDGTRLYFSWDKTGIFNIYTMELGTGQIQQVTNVIGGAFMPSVNQRDELVFSSFVAEGYKIARLDTLQPVDERFTQYHQYRGEQIALASGNGFLADMNLSGIKAPAYDDSQIPDYEVKPYKNQFTSISVLPRFVLDYGTLKVGTYLTSRDMLDKYSFTAGVAANTRKDYDAFLLVDYNELGPNLFLEAFNQVLHTEIDDNDIRYDLAQINVGLRHAFNRQHHSRLSFVYNRYNAKIGFEDRLGIKQSFGYTYHIGKSIEFEHRYRLQPRAVDSAINPRTGRDVRFRYAFELNDFLNSDPEQAFRPTEFGTFVEVYEPHNVHRFELDWTERFPMPGHTGLTFFGRGGLLSRDVDSFFYFYAGGLTGIRGYPFYSMEGRYLLHGRLTYRFPLFRHLDLRLLHLYFDKAYFAISYDYGGAFTKTSSLSELSERLHDSISLQLRLDTFSFYGLPSRVFFDAAYGFDRFSNRQVEYGKEWRFYFGLLFDFLDN